MSDLNETGAGPQPLAQAPNSPATAQAIAPPTEHRHWWDGMTDAVRRATPAAIVNNGARINFGCRLVGDSMGAASALRPGSASPLRLVAYLFTIPTLFLALFYKEKPVDKAQLDDYRQMSHLQYGITKLKQAFDPKNHVSETTGLATMLNGLFVMGSGIMQSSRQRMSLEVVLGGLTTAAGAALTFMPDREKAWQLLTTLYIARIPVKERHTKYAQEGLYKNTRPGDNLQRTGFTMSLLASIFGFFYSGVKKMPDGQIIHLGKDEHKLTQQQIDAYKAQENEDAPLTKVSKVSGHEAALPSKAAISQATPSV
jgi:hypothetical protein